MRNTTAIQYRQAGIGECRLTGAAPDASRRGLIQVLDRECSMNSSEKSAGIRMDSLRAFFALAYLLTWVLLAPFFYFILSVLHEPFPWWFWVLVPFAFIGGSGPSVAALVITGRTEGREGLRRLLVSLAVWRVHILWYLFALGLPPAATALSLLIADGGLGTCDTSMLAPHFEAFLSLTRWPFRSVR